MSEVQEIRQRPDGDQVLDRMRADGVFGHRRLFVGVRDGDAVLDLRDGQGRSRLRLRVADDGAAAIEFLDEDGQVVDQITPRAQDS